MFTCTSIFQKNSSRLINLSFYNSDNILPKSRSKIVKASKKQTHTAKDVEKSISKPRREIVQTVVERQNETVTKNEENELRVNEVNIQMLSKNIFNQLFSSGKSSVENSVIEACRADLRKHNIDYTQCDRLPDVRLRLPPLQGSDILEHFRNIGEQQAAPYRMLLQEMAACQLPARPSHWLMEPGWFRYTSARPPQQVPHPPDDALVFDVEVCMSAGSQPTLATAVSKDCWYGWVSRALIEDRVQERGVGNVASYDDLIPLMSPDGAPAAASLADVTEEQRRPRVVIGHNVSYDRIRVKEQYWLPRTGMRFWDTMSMHVCVSGVTSYQRALLKAKEKPLGMEDYDWMEMASLNSLAEVHKLYCGSELSKEARNTFVEGSLEDVRADFQQLMAYCSGDVAATAAVLRQLLPLFLDRFPHPVTLAGMLELGTAYLPVNSNWLQYLESSELAFEERKLEARQLLSLCAERACRLQHAERYRNDLWMWDQDWSTQALRLKKDMRQKTGDKEELREEEYNGGNKSMTVDENEVLELDCGGRLELVDENLMQVLAGQSHKLETLETDELTLEAEFSGLLAKGALLPVKRLHLPGYPAWFRKLCDKPSLDEHWTPGPHNITTSMQVTPKLLSLSWSGYPLHYIRGEGWGYLVPTAAARPDDYVPDSSPQVPLESLLRACPMQGTAPVQGEELDMARLGKGVEQDISKREHYALKKKVPRDCEIAESAGRAARGVALQSCAELVRLPHKDGRASRVGNPLARDFLNLFSQKVLSGRGEEAEKVLMLARMTSYWRNNRERITEQQVVWLSRDGASQYGAILPQVAVCGTLTRRAMEATWMTASNAHAERVGSELRAMVQAPPGYHFVGADVDSQELWIASLLGDSGCGVHGGTPLGWAVLAGTKSRGTDLHSLTARAIAISRDHAKVINYARIYGAGQNFAEQLLKQFNASLTSTEARSKAAKMFATTKGRRAYTMKSHVAEELGHEVPQRVSAWEARRLATMCGRPVEEIFERPLWVGGTESAMFNKLEEIADAEDARTSFLHGRMTRALEGAAGRWAPTRINWAVQSGAADFLHLLLVNMRWLGGDLIRFSLSFHDEVRYLVPERERYQAALALHITNLYTRAFCAQSVGLKDLSQSVAFFTSVEVDGALRKEARAECITPSNPLGLRAGYGLEPGEALDVKQASDLCGDSLRGLYDK